MLVEQAREASGELAAQGLEELARTYWRRPVLRAEVGCTLSHLDAWERICTRGGGGGGRGGRGSGGGGKVRRGKRGGGGGDSGGGGGSGGDGVAPDDTVPALVFEDDAKLHPRFKRRLVEYLRAAPAGWELLHLVHAPRLPGWYYNRTRSGAGANIVRGAEYESMTLAYALTASGACKLAEGFDRRNVIASDEYVPALSAPHIRPDVRALYAPTLSAYACHALPVSFLREEARAATAASPADSSGSAQGSTSARSRSRRKPYVSAHLGVGEDPALDELLARSTQPEEVGCGLVSKSEHAEASDIDRSSV